VKASKVRQPSKEQGLFARLFWVVPGQMRIFLLRLKVMVMDCQLHRQSAPQRCQGTKSIVNLWLG
jgi:hypothetical protein